MELTLLTAAEKDNLQSGCCASYRMLCSFPIALHRLCSDRRAEYLMSETSFLQSGNTTAQNFAGPDCKTQARLLFRQAPYQAVADYALLSSTQDAANGSSPPILLKNSAT